MAMNNNGNFSQHLPSEGERNDEESMENGNTNILIYSLVFIFFQHNSFIFT